MNSPVAPCRGTGPGTGHHGDRLAQGQVGDKGGSEGVRISVLTPSRPPGSDPTCLTSLCHRRLIPASAGLKVTRPAGTRGCCASSRWSPGPDPPLGPQGPGEGPGRGDHLWFSGHPWCSGRGWGGGRGPQAPAWPSPGPHLGLQESSGGRSLCAPRWPRENPLSPESLLCLPLGQVHCLWAAGELFRGEKGHLRREDEKKPPGHPGRAARPRFCKAA